MTYADSTGKSGSLTDGAVEWMQAGSGVWHTGRPAKGQAIRGYQLWLALPQALELTPPQGLYVEPSRIQRTGPARVLLGRYDEANGPIAFPVPVTYLHVRLQDAERWTYRPDVAHNIAWLAINSGKIRTGSVTLERELAVFAQGNDSIDLVAEGSVEFVIGSAVKHPYPLINGNHSVHTNAAALAQGERNIEALKGTDAVAALRRA